MNYVDNDSPIKNKEEDLLNRTQFVENLSDTIMNIPQLEKSMTIGIIGKWGYGKSSIINMVEEEINNKNNSKEMLIFKFNPWYFSNQHDLINCFFNELIIFLKNNGLEENYIEYIKYYKFKLIKYNAYILEDLINIIPLLGNIKSPSKIGEDLENTFSKEETILDLKEKLEKILKEFGKRIIIIIDDIDRLMPEEIKQIFQLVKSLCDFPNIIYILSFDKQYVITSLNANKLYDSEEFIEKIIQIPIEIPEISKNNMKNIFIKNLKIILDKQDINFEENELEIIFNYCYPFFKNIRFIKRFLNTLNFYLTIVKNEINIIDFILIKLIQIVEKELYDEIKTNKDLLIDVSSLDYMVNIKTNNQKSEQYFNNLIENLSEDNKNKLKPLLLYLFPKIKNIKKGVDYYKNQLKDENKRRLCCEKHFNYYFTFQLNKELISRIRLKTILDIEDEELFSKEVKNLNEEGIFQSFISNIEYKIKNNELEEDKIINIIKFLITEGNDLNYPIHIWDKYDYFTNIILESLDKINESSYSIIKNSLNNVKNTMVITRLIYIINNESTIINNKYYLKPYKICFNEDEIEELNEITSKKISDALKNKYIPPEEIILLINTWKNFEDENVIKNIISNLCEEEDILIYILKGFKIKNNSLKENKVLLKEKVDELIKRTN